jgi:hypothetical protein
MAPIFDGPLHDFAFLEIHRFGDGRREVDVPLIGAALALNQLHFCWIAHNDLLSDT